MKKILSLVLAVLMVASTFAVVLNAKNVVISEAVETPELDGYIDEDEYAGGLKVSFGGEDDPVIAMYGYNAAGDSNPEAADAKGYIWDEAWAVARGSHILGQSYIYVTETAEGIYFAFDVADTTPGANYMKDKNGHTQRMFGGDVVHVTIKNFDDRTVRVSDYDNGDAIRFSVAPFCDDFAAFSTGVRKVKLNSSVTGCNGHKSNSGVDITDQLYENASSDSDGYEVEFLVTWDMLEYYGFNGPTSYQAGTIYFNFSITDAFGPTVGGWFNGAPDYGVVQIPVNTNFEYVSYDPTSPGSADDYLFVDGNNWGAFPAGSGDSITINPFTDVKGDYYFTPVMWAVEKGITNGTSDTTFSPNDVCTRGQIVTFLWRMAGKPESSISNPFVDVKSTDYCEKAVLWAVENGITNGADATHFDPNGTCTRGQAVTFMYRMAGKPSVSTTNPFNDVKAGEYYENAVLWAVENGITNGTDPGFFSPDDFCTRAQIVTFLHRFSNIDT